MIIYIFNSLGFMRNIPLENLGNVDNRYYLDLPRLKIFC